MSKKILLGAVLPFLTNPVVLAVVGIGAAGYALYDIFSDKEGTKENPDQSLIGDERFNEPFHTVQTTVDETVRHPFDDPFITVENTLVPPLPTAGSTVTLTDDDTVAGPDNTVDEEAVKKELIRQAMSELGKRSAAARKAKSGRLSD